MKAESRRGQEQGKAAMKLSQAKPGQLPRLRWRGGGFALGEQPAWLSGEEAKQNRVDSVVGLQKSCSLRVHPGLTYDNEKGRIQYRLGCFSGGWKTVFFLLNS